MVVTFSLRTFPEEALEPYGQEAKHPDDFVIDHDSAKVARSRPRCSSTHSLRCAEGGDERGAAGLERS
jgi:hypothetical protein